MLAHALQPPQQQGDVRAEDAAVDMCLVDDNVAQLPQRSAPALVVR